VGDGVLAGLLVRGNAAAEILRRHQARADGEVIVTRFSRDHRDILALRVSLLELSAKRGRRGPRASEHQHARDAAIKPLHDPQRFALPQGHPHDLDQRARLAVGGGHCEGPPRLVDHDDRLIQVQEIGPGN